MINPAFEQLCEREFSLTCIAAYDGIEQEIEAIKRSHSADYVSAATGKAVADAVLTRFQRILDAFDRAYLAKWRDDPNRPLTEEEAAWLTQKAGLHLDAAVREVGGKCNTYLGEPRTFFETYWLGAGVKARELASRVHQQIELLKLQKVHAAAASSSLNGGWTHTDHAFALMALDEARKSVDENDGRIHPKVGVVIALNGVLLAVAHRGEKPGCHAEYFALEHKLADVSLVGATVYTTLEPCTERNHPKVPCARRLVERKIKRVVIGTLDANPAITGRGQLILREANIITDLFPHDLMAQIEELNREFNRVHRGTGAAQPATSPATDAVTNQMTIAESQFFDQLSAQPITPLLSRIRQKPYWRTWIRPTEFKQAQFRDLSYARHFIEHHRVASRPSWDYPVVKLAEIQEGPDGQYIAGEFDEAIPGVEHQERWMLFRSGQFVDNRALSTIPQPKSSIHYLEILQFTSQVATFVARMAREGALSPVARISIELHNVLSMALYLPDGSESRWSKEPHIQTERIVASAELEEQYQDLALDLARDLYQGFGWISDKAVLAEKQKEKYPLTL